MHKISTAVNVVGPDETVEDVIDKVTPENRIRIPMIPANRSINLSNAAAIIMYEMWRQLGFSLEGLLSQETGKGYFS